ncbi:uncharacterized protein EDB93DRAFT_857242 [Suillus bovinus]|uniref:uncharacterized protein n=1 Tax=Suillus bovinus TaxID=48563 RepID=UPI001B881548|nr:uncharacterized protein EDB93DRAFT_857242 [Suillus bovinus]KAG2133818.1 hypothetical protein EDB93DRAFT_857242 [Suillus bovinus]
MSLTCVQKDEYGMNAVTIISTGCAHQAPNIMISDQLPASFICIVLDIATILSCQPASLCFSSSLMCTILQSPHLSSRHISVEVQLDTFFLPFVLSVQAEFFTFIVTLLHDLTILCSIWSRIVKVALSMSSRSSMLYRPCRILFHNNNMFIHLYSLTWYHVWSPC